MAETQIIQEEQINTKELFQKIVKFFKLIGSEWRLLLISIAIGTLGSIIFDIKNFKESQYYGELHFNLESGSSNQNAMGSFAGIASAFGVGNMGGSQSNDLFSGGNFTSVISSKALYERALMKEVVVNNRKVLFINYYKDSSDISRKEWAGDWFKAANTAAIKFRFKPKSPDQFSKPENEIVTAIYEKLVKQTTMAPLDKNGSIMVLSANTNSEMLTKIWLETLLKTLEEFYIEVRTKKTKEIYDIQVGRLRELEGKLSSADRQLAITTYQNLNAVDPTAPMRQQQQNRNNSFISNQYYTQMASVENLRMLLIHQTPLFTMLQPVRLPLIRKDYIIGGSSKLGAFLGFFICVVFIIFRRTYQELVS
ncbi:hypothetical protein [Emticicia sp. 21SJ11W-3]|uniref:hypothetical protein n=1 Tax=Emticicia sp. 21SJ11W-3 TaxID=2916755 RepID=UPI0020A0BA8A|nr:hypothetical protein [Emticicia sp. 21SJ11W-3]UTA70150.1 hypothetical protein MB380_10085 [Emticicia sp. 21SJ11W-3]